MEKEDAAERRKKAQSARYINEKIEKIVEDWQQSYRTLNKENQTFREGFKTEMRSMKDQQAADRIVIMESLARLEGKPPGSLLKEADQLKADIKKAREAPDKDPDADPVPAQDDLPA
jgi:hypothetical protein